jgi:hypothetical protein
MSDSVMPLRGRPRKDPGSTWAIREGYWNAMHRDARREAILAQLREAFPEGEQGLGGWPAICAWLNDHGFRNREGGFVTERVARGWQRRLGMPVLRGRQGRSGLFRASLPWASTYLLLAWAASLYRSGGPELPRIVASGSMQIEGPDVVARRTAPSRTRKPTHKPPDRGPIARPSAQEEPPKPAEATADDRAAAEAMRTCTWCSYQWLSPTPFRPTRCPMCRCFPA